MSTLLQEAPAAESKGTKAAKLAMPLRSLQSGMATVIPAVERKTTIPILSGVRIEPLDGEIEFAATNLELAIRARLKMSDAKPAPAMVLPAHKLDSYAKLLQGESVTIGQQANDWAGIRCGRSNTKMAALAASNFPALEQMPEARSLSLKETVLARALERVIFSVSAEESRYVINGALLKADGSTVRLVATDGHRLSCYTIRMDCERAEALVPAGMLAALDKAIDGESERSVSLALTEASIFAERQDASGCVSLSHRKLSANFPNYEAVMPRDTPVIVRADAAALVSAIRRCGAFADERSGAVKLTISPEEITLKSASVDTGETEETVEARSADAFAPFSIGFRGEYLLDALRLIEGDVALRFKDGQSAMLIVDEPAPGEEFRYVVMPMRV